MSERVMWLAKYALTDRVKQVEVVPISSAPSYVKQPGGWLILKIGMDVFETEDEALAAAEAMRAKKVASLRKQIAKLEKLTFSTGASQ